MCKTVVISVSVKKTTINRVDSCLKQMGMGANRSAFTNEAMEFYLDHLKVKNANF